jgi:hypothetical protein
MVDFTLVIELIIEVEHGATPAVSDVLLRAGESWVSLAQNVELGVVS